MKVRLLLAGAAAVTVGCAGAQASAATIVSPCDPLADLSVQATECSGWYSGNLLNNGQQGANVAAQQLALSTIGLNWDGNWNAIDPTKVNASGPGQNVFDFDGLLSGDVWIGIHKGKGGGDGYEGTAFFRLTASDLDSVSLKLNGASSAVVYAQQSPVPEPSTWAMLLLGFGVIGAAMRRRRRIGKFQWSVAR
jgi:hypothetical protein